MQPVRVVGLEQQGTSFSAFFMIGDPRNTRNTLNFLGDGELQNYRTSGNTQYSSVIPKESSPHLLFIGPSAMITDSSKVDTFQLAWNVYAREEVQHYAQIGVLGALEQTRLREQPYYMEFCWPRHSMHEIQTNDQVGNSDLRQTKNDTEAEWDMKLTALNGGILCSMSQFLHLSSLWEPWCILIVRVVPIIDTLLSLLSHVQYSSIKDEMPYDRVPHDRNIQSSKL
jgi:hypothetical protein